MKNTLLSFVKYCLGFGLLFLAATLVQTYAFTPIHVSGNSMVPTLQSENYMILNRLSYQLHGIERFDIVVVQQPERPMIKRIIGLPGEVIEYRDSLLYVNGEQIIEPHIVDFVAQYTYDFKLTDLPGSHTFIPDDMYLVLGDNRLISMDSRVVGLLSKAEILGKSEVVMWPLSDIKIAH